MLVRHIALGAEWAYRILSQRISTTPVERLQPGRLTLINDFTILGADYSRCVFHTSARQHQFSVI
jgi:hypothetical protein